MLTVKEFCAFAKISERYFHVLKAQGLAPEMTRSGRRLHISTEAAKAWLIAHERRAA
jgi:hypothetical protein